MLRFLHQYGIVTLLLTLVVGSGFFAKTALLGDAGAKKQATENIECFLDGKSVFTTRGNCIELSKKAQQPPTLTPVSIQQNKVIEVKPANITTSQPSGPKTDQLQYKYKTQDTIRRIDVTYDQIVKTKYDAVTTKNSCTSDSCRTQEDAIIQTIDNMINAGNKSKDWLRQIIDYIDKGETLDQKSIDSLNKIYDYYN